ncbi:MAG: sulfite exporter TauE/SafE family protein [Acidobacteria bacterium]|nr:sulfite exporter TauE/SafE family protein [Acidobacteriota bacterium]
MFESALLVVAAASGAIAAVTGFGIGSVLTPFLALHAGTKTAVAAVSVPHLIGTALRFWRLRANVDRGVLWHFGLMSAAGGLGGALLHSSLASPALTIVFGALLVFAGASHVTGFARRLRFHGSVAWVAGAASGFFGGLVGNQGGIRSAAMLGFGLRKEAFVGTATAIALLVDGARMPVYVAVEWRQVAAIWTLVLVATAGVLGGTLAGERLLSRVPERHFRQVVGMTILLLGLVTLAGPSTAGLIP